MFTDWLRKIFGNIASAVARILARIGLSANALTIIGCVLVIGVSFIIASGNFVLGGFLLIVTAGIDFLDGTLARQTNGGTKFGSFLDSFLDRISDSAVLMALAWYYMGQPGRIEELLAIIAIVGSMQVSYARARAEIIGIDCKVGLFTRVERFIVILAGLLTGWTSYALWILAIGTPITALRRAWYVYQRTKDQPL